MECIATKLIRKAPSGVQLDPDPPFGDRQNPQSLWPKICLLGPISKASPWLHEAPSPIGVWYSLQAPTSCGGDG